MVGHRHVDGFAVGKDDGHRCRMLVAQQTERSSHSSCRSTGARSEAAMQGEECRQELLDGAPEAVLPVDHECSFRRERRTLQGYNAHSLSARCLHLLDEAACQSAFLQQDDISVNIECAAVFIEAQLVGGGSLLLC